MKKYMTYLLVLVTGILFNIPNIYAKTFNWEEFSNNFINNLVADNDSNLTEDNFTYDNDSLDINVTKDGIEYSMHIDYDATSNTIKYTSNRDLSNENDEIKVTYYAADSLLLWTFYSSLLLDYYGVDLNNLEELNDFFEKSTITTEGETITYNITTDDTSSTITATEIKNFTIDIKKLEEAINEYSITNNDEINSKPNNQTTTVTNPKTGDINNKIYIIISAITFIAIVSLNLKFAKTNK